MAGDQTARGQAGRRAPRNRRRGDQRLQGELDRGAAIAINVFLLTIFLAFAIVFAGAALELFSHPGDSLNNHFFRFLSDFGIAFGSSLSTLVQLLLTVMGLYFIRGVTVPSWYVLTFAAMLTMLAAAYLAMTFATPRFGAIFADSDLVNQNIEAEMRQAEGKEDVTIRTAADYLSSINAFVWLVMAANFGFFIAMLKRDAAHGVVRRVLNKLGFGQEDTGDQAAPEAAVETGV